jgi:hypothetical protein
MKIVKHLKHAALMALFIAAAAVDTHAGVKLGDSTSLDLSLDAATTWTDNLYYTARNRESEMSTSLTPGVTITHDSVNRFTFGFWESFVNYLDHTELDSQLTTASITYSFEPRRLLGEEEGTTPGSSRLRISANASITQLAQNDNTLIGDNGEFLSSVIRQDHYAAGLNGSYGISSRLSLNTGASYGNRHFADFRDRYNDSQSFSVPVTLYYKMPGDRFDLGLTYSWSYTDIEQNRIQRIIGQSPGNQTTHNAGLSIRGAVPGTSKMTMHGALTYGYRSFEDRLFRDAYSNTIRTSYDDATLNYNVGLTYQVRNNVNASLNSGRNFDIGGRGQAITSTYARINVNAVVKTVFMVNSYFDYRRQDFDTTGIRNRVDNLYSVGLGVTYSAYITNLKTWASFSLGYRFLADDSNRIHDFNTSTVSFLASFRF